LYSIGPDWFEDCFVYKELNPVGIKAWLPVALTGSSSVDIVVPILSPRAYSSKSLVFLSLLGWGEKSGDLLIATLIVFGYVTPCSLVEATKVSNGHASSVCPEDELLDLTPCGLVGIYCYHLPCT
jgi:hypothetical protein